jgi:hypothetical protein
MIKEVASGNIGILLLQSEEARIASSAERDDLSPATAWSRYQ